MPEVGREVPLLIAKGGDTNSVRGDPVRRTLLFHSLQYSCETVAVITLVDR